MSSRPSSGIHGLSKERLAVELTVGLSLVALLGWQAWSGLNPSSLWLDDAWSALAIRAESLREISLTWATSPGHSILMWLAGTGPWALEMAAQVPALVAAGLAVLVVFVVVRRWGNLAGGVTAGVIVAMSPGMVALSSRAKHFTLDALLAICLIGLYLWSDGQRHSRTAQWAVGIGCFLAFAVSAGTAPVILALLFAFSFQPVAGREWSLMKLRLSIAGVCGVSILIWFSTVVGPWISDGVRDYWTFAYLPWSDPAVAIGRAIRGTSVIAGELSALPPVAVTVALVVGAVSLSIKMPSGAVVTFGPVVASFALASFGLTPFGGGRTDAVLLTGLAAGLGLSVAAHPRLEWLMVAMVSVAALLGGFTEPIYPSGDIRHATEALEARHKTGEPILVHIGAWHGYALYSGKPIRIVDNDIDSRGFVAVVSNTDLLYVDDPSQEPLDNQFHRTSFESHLSSSGRVWLIGSHLRDPVQKKYDQMHDLIESFGFRQTTSFEFDEAELRVYERPYGDTR